MLYVLDAVRRRANDTLPIKSTPVTVASGLQCGVGLLNSLYCRSPFRWPDRLLFAKFDEDDVRSFTHSLFYSPFPAGLTLTVIDGDDVSTPASARQVSIMTKKPLEHVRLDFDIEGLRLTDSARAI